MTTLRVVVTGAAGFLGAGIVRHLVADRHEVLAWTRTSSDGWRLRDLAKLRRLSSDITDILTDEGRSTASDALADFRPDVLIHAAWQGIRGASRNDPAQVENVALGVEIVRIAAAAGVRRFVGLGSQAEYGPSTVALTELSPTRPTTLYGVAKQSCGSLSLALAHRLGVSAAWVRVFSVYGPGQREGALVPDLARAIHEHRPLAIGSGETPWDYLFEDDAAAAIVRLACRDDARGVFNLASGTAVPIREVMQRIAALVDPSFVLPFGSRAASPDDLPALRADVSRLRDAISWRPVVGLDQGLRKTVSAVLAERGVAIAGPGSR